MHSEKYYYRLWRILYFIGHRYLVTKFNYKHDRVKQEGPCLVISNHVTNWDPMLVAMSFPKKNLHFVASEHLFRMGKVTKLISHLASMIPRRKGSSGLDTAMASLRVMKAGGSVCLFAEGDCTWDGRSVEIVPSTGTLARASGATLITYRIEGGYLSLPRWSSYLRRGRMRGHVVNTYSPEQLRKMKADEIAAIINRDIYEDAWERQSEQPVRFKSKHRAENLESALYICPKCKRVGKLSSSGSRFMCECGLDLEYTEYGKFEPAQPFADISQWDEWQQKALESGDFIHGDELFADDGIELSEVMDDHSMNEIHVGRLSLKDGVMTIGNFTFDFKKLHDMAIVRTNRLIFTYEDKYYELRARGMECLKKYRSAWEIAYSRLNVQEE